MSAVAQPAISRRTHVDIGQRGLSARGLLRSEWIKLRSLRSTPWSLGFVVVVQIGFSLAFGLSYSSALGGEADVGMVATTVTGGIALSQLVVVTLGVLIITGEYSTGQIRSSLTAVPRRLPVLWAKAAVFAVTIFTVSFVAIGLAALASAPLLAQPEGPASIPDLWIRLVGGAAYLTLIGLFALGIGTMLRATAAGITTVLGIILVLPAILSLIPAGWSGVLYSWLPGSVGLDLFFSANAVFEPWQALLVMLGWVGASLGGAAILLRRRDA